MIFKKKKKVIAVIRRLFLAEITTFNVFSGQKQQLFPPQKIPWGGQEINRGAKTKIGGAMPPCAPAGDAPDLDVASVLTKKIENYLRTKEVLQTLFHYSLYPRNRFNLFDSVPLATLRFEISAHQKRMTSQVFCRISNITFLIL